MIRLKKELGRRRDSRLTDPISLTCFFSRFLRSAMSTTRISDSLATSMEVEFAKCECCGLTEEYTPGYIERVRERHNGKWICGLCAEAINDEALRSESLITTEEAIANHMSFCQEFVSSIPPLNPTLHLISAMTHILKRSLDSPRSLRSTPSSPSNRRSGIRRDALARSESCFSSLSAGLLKGN